MHKSVILLVVSAMTISACSNFRTSSYNPVNWFGTAPAPAGAAEVPPLVEPGSMATIVETRPAIAQIASARLDRTANGAIVTATGMADRQGAYDAELVGAPSQGTLTLVFRAALPDETTPVGTTRSREVTVSKFFSDHDLAGISSITVQGEQNALSVRR